MLSLPQDTVFGKGILSFTFPVCNSELLPVVPVPDNPLVNIAFALGKEAFGKGQVIFLVTVVAELSCKGKVGFLSLGYDHDSLSSLCTIPGLMESSPVSKSSP